MDYAGRLVLLTDPTEMADPKAAFTGNPHADCEVHLVCHGHGRGSMFGGEPDRPHEVPGEEFARGHTEQLVHSAGTIRVGDQVWTVDGHGLRDHSWGPRSWQAPWYYRWLTANAGPDFGFMASRVARRDGPGTRGGFVWEDGALHLCDEVEISTEHRGVDAYHQRIVGRLGSSGSGRQWAFEGEVMSLIPLRHRRPDPDDPDGAWLVTRISEGLTRWTTDDGRVGYGLSEYLDQIVDGRPVGVSE